MRRIQLGVVITAFTAATALAGCNNASTTPPPQTVASNASGTTPAHGSGHGTGAHGHSKDAAGNKDGSPGGASTKHGSGQGGGRNGGKPGEALGNKDGHPGGTTAEHGSGHGAGRGGGKKAHTGDKNGKPGPAAAPADSPSPK
jgi:hypothetical protein